MPVPTLLVSPRVTPDSNALLQAAHASGQPAVRLPTFRPTDDLAGKRIAVYGEPLFAIIVAAALDHVLIEPPYDWLTTLPEPYTRRFIELTTIGAARQLQEPHFVKNADGMKAFEAQVYATGDELPASDLYPDDYAVLVSEPVRWEVEYRCFVMDRRIAAHSVYLRDGELAKTEDGLWLDIPEQTLAALAFCRQLIEDIAAPIPPACVIDVGLIDGRGWAVVEANPAYGSGIYGCDPLAALEVVNRACLPGSEVDETTSRWATHYDVSAE